MNASPEITFRPAVESDAPALRRMYDAIIDAMDISTWHTQWSKNGYPSNADFIAFVRKGELHLAFADGELAAAVVLNGTYNRGYDAVKWGCCLQPAPSTLYSYAGRFCYLAPLWRGIRTPQPCSGSCPCTGLQKPALGCHQHCPPRRALLQGFRVHPPRYLYSGL